MVMEKVPAVEQNAYTMLHEEDLERQRSRPYAVTREKTSGHISVIPKSEQRSKHDSPAGLDSAAM
jgi:hypothetical protein